MTKQEAIDAAVKIVGKGEENDYVLAPAAHAEQFDQSAPELAAVLSSSPIQTTADEYKLAEEEAMQARKKFERVFNRANFLVLMTAILMTLILAVGTLSASLPDPPERVSIIVFSLLSVVTGALASRNIFLINQGQLLEDWMSKRAFAETHRLDYFNRIAKAPAAAAALELLKLEYFRRYQLDIQLAYYRNRAKDHAAEASRTLNYGGLAVAGSAVAAGFAGVLGVIDSRFAVLASIGTIFASLASFASLKEATSQNRRNAERYERTFRALSELKKQLDDVRGAVFADGNKPLMDFVNAVNEQLSLEHRQWLGEKSEYQKSIAELTKTISEYKSKKA